METKIQKYFTPNIEDIRVGYECEICYNDHADTWGNYVIPLNTTLSDIESQINLFRTPYLTKEQIENEGWTFDAKTGYFHRESYVAYPSTVLIDKKVHYKFLHLSKHFSDKSIITFYAGQCKDINTFRTICKLLNIT